MAFVTKVWKNRLVEFAGRRKLKNVVTGEEMIVDVGRSEGAVSQTGDAFSDTSMNNLEQRIKNQFDTVDSNLGATVGNGYVKFANGLLLCHGHTYSQTTVTLPISYINAQFSVTVSDLSSDPHFIGCRIVNKSAITPWAWTPSAPALANNILLSYTTIGLYK